MLGLMRKHPLAFIVPTYDMDLMWHTHLAFPCNYEQTCLLLAGFAVRHDHSVNDRAAGSKLLIANTRQLFEKAYGYKRDKVGGMSNGEPPA
eukprot:567285-Rhodomonas_salina.2